MSPQLTLQAPVALPPPELTDYLDKLWSQDLESSSGASTFTLLVWQPAWVEQHLVRTGRLDGPVTGVVRSELLEAAREAVPACGLPLSISPLSPKLAWALGQQSGDHAIEDLRGQHIDSAISTYQPRRLITLAPTLDHGQPLETLVAAYCPLPGEGTAAACGDVVVLRGDFGALQQGLQLLQPLVPADLPCWVWWNGSLDEAPELLDALCSAGRRLVIDTAMGTPRRCLDLLESRVASGQPVNDLNWLRQRAWRESLAMVFDPPAAGMPSITWCSSTSTSRAPIRCRACFWRPGWRIGSAGTGPRPMPAPTRRSMRNSSAPTASRFSSISARCRWVYPAAIPAA